MARRSSKLFVSFDGNRATRRTRHLCHADILSITTIIPSSTLFITSLTNDSTLTTPNSGMPASDTGNVQVAMSASIKKTVRFALPSDGQLLTCTVNKITLFDSDTLCEHPKGNDSSLVLHEHGNIGESNDNSEEYITAFDEHSMRPAIENHFIRPVTSPVSPLKLNDGEVTFTKDYFEATRETLKELIVQQKLNLDDIQSNSGLLVIQMFVQAPWIKDGGFVLRVGLDSGCSSRSIESISVLQVSAFTNIVDPLYLNDYLEGQDKKTLWHPDKFDDNFTGIGDAISAARARAAFSIRSAMVKVGNLARYNCMHQHHNDIPQFSVKNGSFSISSWATTNSVPCYETSTIHEAAVLQVTRDEGVHMILEQHDLLRKLHDLRGHQGARNAMRELNQNRSNLCRRLD